MTLAMTMYRSTVLAMGLLAITACSAAQGTETDPCVKVTADALAISRQNVDAQAMAAAMAAHVVAHGECFPSETVAKSRAALAQLHQNESMPTPTWAQNWFEKNGY